MPLCLWRIRHCLLKTCPCLFVIQNLQASLVLSVFHSWHTLNTLTAKGALGQLIIVSNMWDQSLLALLHSRGHQWQGYPFEDYPSHQRCQRKRTSFEDVQESILWHYLFQPFPSASQVQAVSGWQLLQSTRRSVLHWVHTANDVDSFQWVEGDTHWVCKGHREERVEWTLHEQTHTYVLQ